MKSYKILLISVSFLLQIFLLFCSSGPENYVISNDSVEIRFDVSGRGEPALVFVHGWASEREDWRFQKDYFSKNFQVVTIDLAGFGESGNNREKWTVEAFGKDVASVIEHLKTDKIILIGQSMGGAVILEAARLIPERILGLVPVDVFQNVEMEPYTREKAEQRVESLMNLVNNTDEERLRDAFKREIKPEIIEKIMDYYKNSPKTGWRESLISMLIWRTTDLTSILKEISNPICCINSDRIFTNVETARKYAPSFNARIIKNVGHPVMLDAPDDFNSVLMEIISEFKQ